MIFIYKSGPTDDWSPWLTEAEYKKRLETEYGPDAPRGWAGYLALRKNALDKAKAAGWEGDFRQGPFVSGLPPVVGHSTSELMIAWKQDNNGTCFIASPYKLSWLHDEQ